MLPGIDNPGKHSSATVLFEYYVSSVEYYYITLASPGRLYPCRWRHTRDHGKSLLAPSTEVWLNCAKARNLLEGTGFEPPPS